MAYSCQHLRILPVGKQGSCQTVTNKANFVHRAFWGPTAPTFRVCSLVVKLETTGCVHTLVSASVVLLRGAGSWVILSTPSVLRWLGKMSPMVSDRDKYL